MAATTKTLVNQFVKWSRVKKKHDAELEKANEELRNLEAEILKRFEEAGLQSMKLTDGATVHIRREVWAGQVQDVDNAEFMLLEGLKSAGLGDLVKEKVNTQTLSSWVREKQKEIFGDKKVAPEELLAALPEPLHQTMRITETYKLRALGV